MFGILILMGLVQGIVGGTYWCGDGICEAEYCPSDCVVFLASYCEGLIEPWECDDICGTELGWIRPPDCLDYGYHLECDSCCVDGNGLPTDRGAVDDFCRGYGYIREEDCLLGECTITDCEGLGMIDPDDCAGMPDCIELGYIQYDDCPECGIGYEECDSCCPSCESLGYLMEGDLEEECPFQWWLLVIGGFVGYLVGKNKKKRR